MINTYVARRRLQMQPGLWREPGELVPEAHTWHRLDSFLHTGYVGELEVSEAELRAAVDLYCPDIAARIYELAGVDAELDGPRKSPRRTRKAPVEETPVVVTLKDAPKES